MNEKRAIRKQRRLRVAAEHERRWAEWLNGDGRTIRDAGFPAEVIRDEAHWTDFVLHGTLHYHAGMPESFKLEQLPIETLTNVLRFLERTLEPDLLASSDLVGALNQLAVRDK